MMIHDIREEEKVFTYMIFNFHSNTYMKQLPTDRSADRSTGPISLINYLISEVINFGRM